MRKVLILEDNSHIAEELKRIALRLDLLLEFFICSNCRDAWHIAEDEVIAIFIVDIMLNEDEGSDDFASGLEFVDALRKLDRYRYSPVIFVTAYPETKLYAYEKLHCYRFLEKPFSEDEAGEMISQALDMSEHYKKGNCIYIKLEDYIVVPLVVSDIVYVQYKKRKSTIVTGDGKYYRYYKTLTQTKIELDSDSIIQCNRNTLINCQYIEWMDLRKREIWLKDIDTPITLGKTYRQRIQERFYEKNDLHQDKKEGENRL